MQTWLIAEYRPQYEFSAPRFLIALGERSASRKTRLVALDGLASPRSRSRSGQGAARWVT